MWFASNSGNILFYITVQWNATEKRGCCFFMRAQIFVMIKLGLLLEFSKRTAPESHHYASSVQFIPQSHNRLCFKLNRKLFNATEISRAVVHQRISLSTSIIETHQSIGHKAKVFMLSAVSPHIDHQFKQNAATLITILSLELIKHSVNFF